MTVQNQKVQENFKYLRKIIEENWCWPRGYACQWCRASYLDYGSRNCSLEDVEHLIYDDLLKILKEEQ